jgi:putative ABC transport system permease protein
MIALGLVIGGAAAALLSRYLETQLFQVARTDPSGFLAVGLLAVVAVAACCVPAYRATRVNPVSALRTD